MTSPNQPLHTLEDPSASDYIDETLGDGDPLLPSDVPQAPYSDQYYRVPRQADYENMFDHQKRTPYYVQQSYEENEHNIYTEDSRWFSMSPVRRMFCLLALFDLLLTFLMWAIYLQIKPGGITGNLTPEVKNLNVKSSFFDIVICSFVRALLLLLFYFVIKLTKWYIVAITTSVSTIFLLMKVFLLQKDAYDKGQPMNFFLIIFSFVICWCEAWHFDFKVIPSELRANQVANSRDSFHPPADRGRRQVGAASSAFFTPYARSLRHPAGSQIDEESVTAQSEVTNLSEEFNEADTQDAKWIRMANDNVHMVFRMLYISDGWILHRQEKDDITVHSKHFDGIGKVYKLEATVDVPSTVLLKMFWEDVNNQPEWNASVKESRIVKIINKKTDILYSVAAEAAGGMISPRDFVSLRRLKRKGALTLLCGMSIETDLEPPKPSVVRGHNGPGGWILRDIPSEPNRTEFIWLLNTELNGWLPKKLVETSLAGVMVDTLRDIRTHSTNIV